MRNPNGSPWNPLNYNPGELAKTIAAFVVPGLITAGNALTEGSDGGVTITASEWIAILIACVGTAGTVFAVSNKPTNNGGEAGAAQVWFIIGAVLIVVALLGLFHILAISLSVAVALAVVGLVLCVVGSRA